MSPTLASHVMKDIAMYLLDEVEQQKLAPDRAAEISKMVPQMLDEAMTDDKTYEGITKLIASFPELAKLLNEYAVKKDDVATAKLLEETQKSLEELKKEMVPDLPAIPIQSPTSISHSETTSQPVAKEAPTEKPIVQPSVTPPLPSSSSTQTSQPTQGGKLV